MEILGEGLKAIGNAASQIGWMSGMVCMCGIISVSLLIYAGKITIDDIKDLFKKDRNNRYR